MPNWCQKRITSIELKVRFGDGKHRFYLESVCASPVQQGKLCDRCRMLQIQTKTQDVRTFPHGFVLDEYSEESHIFDSPWYHFGVKAYGPPSTTDVALAMEAQRRARSGTPTKAMKDLIDILIAGNVSVTAPIAAIPTAPAVQPQSPTVKPKRTKKVKKEVQKAKEVVAVESTQQGPSEIVCTSVPKHIQYVESTDDPMEITVVPVALKKLVYKGEDYWHDSAQGFVYAKSETGKKGDYIGQWDAELCAFKT